MQMITEDCLLAGKCFQRSADILLERIAPDLREAIMCELKPLVESFHPALPPPLLIRECFRHIAVRTGIADPYREIKDHSIESARQLLELLRPEYEAAEAPFALAVRWAIAGNILDYGAIPDLTLEWAEKKIRAAGQEPLDVEPLRKRVQEAGNILYILDNCGESVFDRLLLEHFADRVTLAVRGSAILNDVTRREIAPSGLTGFPVVDTGDSTPGVSLPDSGKDFKRAVDAADLVICKGMGNFETLEGWKKKDTFFLFLAKCPHIEKRLGAAHLSMQLICELAQ